MRLADETANRHKSQAGATQRIPNVTKRHSTAIVNRDNIRKGSEPRAKIFCGKDMKKC